jgi:lambda family phage portal protein
MMSIDGPKPNWLDNAIAAISPSWGEKRMKARHIYHANRVKSHLLTENARSIERRIERNRQEESRYFEGAENDDRRSFGWQMIGQSPNEGMLLDLQALRAKSRFLAFSDDYFSGAIEGCIQQSIGKGMKMQSQARACKAQFGVPEISETTADDVRTVLEQAWHEQSEEITDDGLEWGEALEQILWHVLVDGAGPHLMFDEDRSDRPTSLSIELIDPWLIEPPAGADFKTNPLGIETQNGRPVRVHFRKSFNGMERDSAPAERLPIAFRRRWTKQQLGLPWIFAASGKCYDRKAMFEAELISNQIAACFSVFVKSDGNWGSGDEQKKDSKDQSTRLLKNIKPGMIIQGGPMDEVTPINPSRPANSFSPFMELNNRGLGAALNYPYEYLANDFSKTTYLSGRMSQILGREFFRCIQWMLARRTCKPTWRAFVSRMAVSGELPISTRQYAANRRAIEALYVQPRGWMWIDPNKDLAAAIDALGANLTTLKDEYDQRGEDYEEKLAQREYEKKLERQKGIAPEVAGAAAAPPPATTTARKTPVPSRAATNPDDYSEDDDEF